MRTVWANSAAIVQEPAMQQTVRVAAVQAEPAWLDLAAGWTR
jgi:hypothetical protein